MRAICASSWLTSTIERPASSRNRINSSTRAAACGSSAAVGSSRRSAVGSSHRANGRGRDAAVRRSKAVQSGGRGRRGRSPASWRSAPAAAISDRLLGMPASRGCPPGRLGRDESHAAAPGVRGHLVAFRTVEKDVAACRIEVGDGTQNPRLAGAGRAFDRDALARRHLERKQRQAGDRQSVDFQHVVQVSGSGPRHLAAASPSSTHDRRRIARGTVGLPGRALHWRGRQRPPPSLVQPVRPPAVPLR